MNRSCIPIKLAIALALLLQAGCATLPKDFERPASYAMVDTKNPALERLWQGEGSARPEESGFHLLGNGLDAFVARAALSHSAKHSIDVQYYLYHDDLVGKLFTDLLLKAADRGVRVRLLLDDMDLSGRDRNVAAMDHHPHIEVRIFNPFSRNTVRLTQFVTRMGSVTRRMHNKSFTVDNQVTILGGRNIGDEYFNADPNFAFADLDVMANGPVVKRVSGVFDLYWNDELAYPASVLMKGKPISPEEVAKLRQALTDFVNAQTNSVYIQALRDSDLARQIERNEIEFYWGDAEVVFDQPEKLVQDFDETEYHLSVMLKPYWEDVTTDLIIFSPYFVPGKQGTAFISQLAQRGVRVRILTNSLASNDVGLVHAGYRKYRKKLLRSGVELYEMNKNLTPKERKARKGAKGSAKASLHAKSFVFDRENVFIGSLNLDPRALVHNTEIGVVFNVPEIARQMAQWFDDNIEQFAFRLELEKSETGNERLSWHGWENGQSVVYTHEPHTGFWRRFGIGFMSIWPIESQL